MYYDIDNELESEYKQNIAISQSIRNALDKNLVTIECQPIYDAKTKGIFSYEALMRIKNEDGTMMYPGMFLEVAKKTSFYPSLTQEVIRLTFELMKSYPDMRFAVNLSFVDILSDETLEVLLNHLNECKRPEYFTVEILETESMENYDKVKSNLKKIKQKGCKIAIDDFGSGYSNYYRVMQLDIDYIKIDGSIIKELPHDKNARVVVETIVEFAKKKGYKIVAEFVSNEQIYDKVKRYGIEYMQGFYLGKPRALKTA